MMWMKSLIENRKAKIRASKSLEKVTMKTLNYFMQRKVKDDGF